MLRSLQVRDFAIVEEVELAFGAGMTVVTGETGAGKSLLVDALLLLTGARAEAALVRHGCERAELAAEFDLAGQADTLAWLREAELDEDAECRLRRVIRNEGSSRAWINGRSVSLGQLRELGARLVEIHGQHEQQALLERASQLEVLDHWGGHLELRAEVARLAGEWRAIGTRIAALGGSEDRDERIAWLEHQLGELDAHALDAPALAELEERHRRLANAGRLLQGLAALAEGLDGEGELALLPRLARLAAELQQLAGLDTRLEEPLALLDNARIQLSEAHDFLAHHADRLDLDPERLAEVEAQLARLHDLARKHRVRPEELPAEAERLRSELEGLRNAGSELARLAAEREHSARAWREAAARLGAARRKAATALGERVSALMAELGMAGGRFEVAIEPQPADEPDPQGAERCEFLVAANPGQPPRPLRKVASGGELSRISLAIEVAALGGDTVPTMVFDEVDSGIGGAVAEIVGQKLRTLGNRCQVLCVTHLPQVAAQGHAHLRASKREDGGTMRTRVETLDAAGREAEIARMLGGVEITAATAAHAAEMLAEAQRS